MDIPLSPVYTVVLSREGGVMIDGKQIFVESGQDARLAAIEELHRNAALRGRPVRAVAKEVNGICTPIVVHPSGRTTVLDQPHPAEVSQPHELEFWESPLPWWVREEVEKIRKLDTAGQLTHAIDAAFNVETRLAALEGPDHPWTVKALTLRSWLTLRAMQDWGEITDLLIETVRRRNRVSAPNEETARIMSNAHAAWRRLPREDALRRASDLVDVDPSRREAVVAWAQRGAAEAAP